MKHENTQDLRLAMALYRITNAFDAQTLLTLSRMDEGAYHPLPIELRQSIQVLGVVGARLALEGKLDHGHLRKAMQGDVKARIDGELQVTPVVDFALNMISDDEDLLSVNNIIDSMAEALHFHFSVKGISEEELADSIYDNNPEGLKILSQYIMDSIEKGMFIERFLLVVDSVLTDLMTLESRSVLRRCQNDSDCPGEDDEVSPEELYMLSGCEYSMEGLADAMNLLMPVLFATVANKEKDLMDFLARINLIGIAKAYRRNGRAWYGEEIETETELLEAIKENPEHFFHSSEFISLELLESVSGVLYAEFFEELPPLRFNGGNSALILEITPEQLARLLHEGGLMP